VSRFGVRTAKVGDAAAIARAHTESWQTSYRGILPDNVLDRVDVGQRADSRRRILADRSIFQLVAFDFTHGDIVGFCDAGPARRHAPYAIEIYALYMVHRAKRHGLGQEMFERVQAHFAASGKRSLIIWVLENNLHARGFYEAMGGRPAMAIRSTIGGYPVTERAYVWDRF
jgi:GNAT superfamily N-acetyltransferase